MKEDIKNQWIEALRSGKYKQGPTYLRQRGRENEPDRFCCLGVLCDILRPEGWEMEISGLDHWVNFNGNRGVISLDVQLASGLRSSLGNVYLPNDVAGLLESRLLINEDNETNLARLNDKGRLDFNQIADFIEANWEKL